MFVPCQRGRALPTWQQPTLRNRDTKRAFRVSSAAAQTTRPGAAPRPSEGNDKHHLLLAFPTASSPWSKNGQPGRLRGRDQELVSLPASSSSENGKVFLFAETSSQPENKLLAWGAMATAKCGALSR